MPVIATAGHVDHGKSTLVRALTGTDPDRWAEEKARGLTIDLGFAWCALPTAGDVAFVDVPGHVRFISNMLAGAGAVDACLFVVAATEGWKPQSEEHLRILELLGVGAGVIALTMAGLVDDDARELAAIDTADRVAGTFLDGAPIVAVDAPTGVGMDELVDALDGVVGALPPRRDAGRPRLWVDRAFAARGAGTVVTGTLTGGGLAVDDELVVEPAGAPVRVRALQSHERSYDAVAPGRRVAVNLAGVAHTDVRRGDALVRPDEWRRVRAADCELRVVPGLGHEVSRRGAFQAYVGSGHYAVQIRLLGTDAIGAGERGTTRVHLPTPLPLLPGDRYVLRESGRGETVGGGEILDVDPALPASRARPDRSVDRVIDERGWVTAADLERLTGERRPPSLDRWVASAAALAELRADVLGRLECGPVDVATLGDKAAAMAAVLDGVVVEHGRARLAAQDAFDWEGHPFYAALTAAPFSPPAPEAADRDGLRELVRRGLVVERDGVDFAADAVAAAADQVAGLLAASPTGVTVGAVRDALGNSRKHVVPLLAHLDATGVTRRRGDLRVAGPRLPAPKGGE